ncbi:hypothetical protein Tco_1522808, partial [Tanacetum coccineum]
MVERLIDKLPHTFLAIVYNDALTSKLDSLTEPAVRPHHIDELDLKNDTSLSKHDEEEQNIVYFNDLFPINMIYPDDLKSDNDNDDDKIDIIQSSGIWLFYLEVFDFGGLTALMDEGLSGRMLMEYRDAQAQSIFTSRAWRRLFEIRGSLVYELILEFFSTFRFGEAVLDLDAAGALQFQLGGVRHRVDVDSVNIPYLLARYLRLFASRRKRGTMISRGQFVDRLTEHFKLLTEERLQGLTMIMRDLPVIDMAELVAAAGALKIAEGDPDVVEDDQAVPAHHVHGNQVSLGEQRKVVDAMARDFSRFTVWAARGPCCNKIDELGK